MFKLVVCEDGIANEEDDETQEDYKESDIVCPATSAPDGPLRVLNSIWVVEGIIKVDIIKVCGCADRICLLGRAEWFLCVRLLAEAWTSNRLRRLLGLLELENG